MILVTLRVSGRLGIRFNLMDFPSKKQDWKDCLSGGHFGGNKPPKLLSDGRRTHFQPADRATYTIQIVAIVCLLHSAAV